MPRHHEGRPHRRRHDGVRALDGLPDDLVEEQVVGAILDLEVEASETSAMGRTRVFFARSRRPAPADGRTE